jgi:hypothetical protein
MSHMRGQPISPTRVSLAVAARYGASAVVLAVLVVLAWRLALAPGHGVRDAAGCERAYAAARTHADTVSAAFLSYPDPTGRNVKRRCGELRPATVGSALGR